jgi:hypothetical protein
MQTPVTVPDKIHRSDSFRAAAIQMAKEQYPSGACLVALAMMSGLKLARNASRLDLEKEVLCVSISARP